MKFESMHHLEGVEIPNDNVSLYRRKKPINKFEFNGAEIVTGEFKWLASSYLPRNPYESFILTRCIFQSLRLQSQRYRYRGPNET